MKLLRIVVTIVLFWFFGNITVYAQSNIYKLHSLFIYNFTKHVQWTNIDDGFTIGVFGSENALKEVKANFAGKKFSGKDIQIIKVSGIGEANASQLIYTPKSNANKILNLFEDADKNNTLFVSEDDFIENGFPISFVINGSKLGFKVSKKNLEACGLKISSSLLSLAEVVD
jgi:hypothetical protein